ncbi:MAG: hypothetical protein HPY83_11375 [Anaerolineae bacterium]|nr:hypothetical protein [Anaerolineae bacterium]
MTRTRRRATPELLAILSLAAIGLLLAACGSTPVPPTLPPPAPTAAPSPTSAPEAPTATVAAAEVPTEPSATATTKALDTPTPQAAPTLPAQALEPAEHWVVRNLMVGPGRTYVFLADLSGRYQLLYSDDDGQTWAPFPGELPLGHCLNNVNIDYAAIDSLYAGACEGGLYHWNGSEWERISDQRVGTLEVVYLEPQLMWSTDPAAGPGDPKISRSEDGGRTWVAADSGIDSSETIAYLGMDPRDSNTFYAMGRETLYRGTADGQWKAIPTARFPSTFTGMAIEGGNGALYVSLSAPNNQIWRSQNPNMADVTGVRWGLLHDFGERQAVHLMATGPSSHPVGVALYANLAEIQRGDSGDRPGNYLPYRSPDGGITWERIVIPGWIE